MDCIDEASRDTYIEEYARKEGIFLDKENIEKNPVLRFLAKLCLNSFWSKFGQRENLGTTELIREPEILAELAFKSPDKELLNVLPVNEDIYYVNWAYKGDNYQPSSITNVVIAAYTTAHARLELYKYLEKLGDRVLYYDTDRCIYLNKNVPGEYRVPTGRLLGDMTNELECYAMIAT